MARGSVARIRSRLRRLEAGGASPHRFLGVLEPLVQAEACFALGELERTEEALGAVIRERHPEAAVLAEELSPKAEGADLTFIADPLDGTTNFLHGFPWYAVSIAARAGDALVAGAVLNVANGDLFTAARGAGARRNGQPIHVSAVNEPARALIGTGFPFKNPEHLPRYQEQFARVMKATSGIRRAGSAALDLADVAAGRFDGFWELYLAPWDIAAGILLVREAGGVVTDLSGKKRDLESGAVVAGNPALHAWLLKQLV